MFWGLHRDFAKKKNKSGVRADNFIPRMKCVGYRTHSPQPLDFAFEVRIQEQKLSGSGEPHVSGLKAHQTHVKPIAEM